MASPRRSPVHIESYLMNSIGVCWPQIKNRKIQLQMNILAEMLNEEINKKNGKQAIKKKTKKSEPTESEEIRFFIACFRQRFAQEVDIEYKTKIDKEEIAMIKALTNKLRSKNVSIEDYLSWFFDVFYDDDYNRKKYTPMIKFVCGSFITTKFFANNRDVVRKNQRAIDSQSKREAVRAHAKELFRRTGDPRVQLKMQMEFEGTIPLSNLEEFLEEYETKNNNDEEK
jgi:hypothetical protein